jgi:N4-(beta-N-acetylglucosaminyl)-L-asparaginase
VTLDASIMDHEFNCGSVAFLERIKHPISVPEE